ncbi:hypothetical protein BD309DRAFT_957281 [Dichomitus squalens]|uniref:Uncharacterized protein n=2 Tax=Dichomitus squalens TaxID=114155 RepID=A0A4V6MWR0_9APHY|nr:uncharacterized protein DICSQDRAFT_139822 [Dichomitus squalens LYAD-421 SS1]EJF57984.1 hypothetical protein DICSQDRAFT_139822 [Dichomitus squalens LYAD-421 SS1]TBU44946.1 hypothetical protein BD309DRAFT_957281 [Dichomitus squalens]TBU56498.1 hypothetical protein BD310DRAFT_931292 [Dichomitus squalens]
MSETKQTCTCGQCFEGWLSPRMKELLDYSTELRYGLAKSLLHTQDGVGEDVTSVLPIDYTHIDNSVYYLPLEVRHKIGPSTQSGDAVYRGYIAVFEAIKDLLSEERKDFPTVATVSAKLAELRDSEDASLKPIAVFLDNGGKAEYALDCIVDRAREELTPLGRLYDAETQYIDAVLDGEENHEKCANDLDFGLVREKLGLSVESLGALPDDDEDSRDPVSDDEE